MPENYQKILFKITKHRRYELKAESWSECQHL